MPEKSQNPQSINFHVTRYNPERDRGPYVQVYAVPVRAGMTVLDGLHYIKENLDASLAWRYSCRMGICGSCGMLLNGRPSLACNTQILHIATSDLTVGPLPNFAIVRDLVPDLMTMFDQHRSLKPFLVRADEACPTLAADARYLGPMPLAAAQRYNADTRDDGRAARSAATGSAHGAFRCHYAGECSRVCPKGVDPAKAIQLLKRQLVLDYLHLASRNKPCQKLHGPGQTKPHPNIPPAPPKTV